MLIETKLPLYGIIGTYKIQFPDEDPLEIFIPTASSYDNGNITTLIIWNSSFQTQSNRDSFVEIEIKNYYVHPIGYALKGYQGKNYAIEWMFQGIDDKGNTIDIEQNTSEGSLYCNSKSDYCSNNEWGYFQLKNIPNKVFKKLRWKIIEGSRNGSYHMALSGIEIYGILSETGKKYKEKRMNICSNFYKFHYLIPSNFIMCFIM